MQSLLETVLQPKIFFSKPAQENQGKPPQGMTAKLRPEGYVDRCEPAGRVAEAEVAKRIPGRKNSVFKGEANMSHSKT